MISFTRLTFAVIVSLSTLTFMTVLAKESQQNQTINLLESQNLDDWTHVLEGDNATKEEVWSFNEQGHLVSTGKPIGFLATKEKYQNFQLVIEWRWPESPSNSGVLMRIQSDDPIPACIEAQLKHGAAGNIMGLRGVMIEGEDLIKADNENLGTINILKRKGVREKRPGEWNKMEITAKDGEIVMLLNGSEGTRTSDADTTAGAIGFQSEGAPIEFKTIELTPLP